MNRLIIITLLTLLASCSVQPSEHERVVQDAYPEAEVTNVPGNLYQFIIRNPDGSVYWVNTSSRVQYGSAESIALIKSTVRVFDANSLE